MKTIRTKNAFTLIELIVSLAITSVIAFFVFSFAASLANLWRNTESGVDTELDAQIALDRIAMDLESAVFQERVDADGNPVPMFALSAIAKDAADPYRYDFSDRWEGIADSARPAAWHFDPKLHRYGWAGSWLRFFTAAPSFNAVGYQLIRRPAFSDSKVDRYLLHRSIVQQDYTLDAGFDITSSRYSKDSALYEELEKTESSPYALQSPWVSSVILEDVVDFGLRLYVFDENFPGTDDSPRGLRLIFPADSNGKLSSSDKEHVADSLSGTNYASRYPEVMEVFLRVLDDVGSDLLARLEDGEDVLSYEEILEKHSRFYRRMIRLPGRESKGYNQ